MRRIYALALLPVLAVAGCVTAPNGKPVISAAAAAADLTQGANILALANALYAISPNANVAIEADLGNAQTALSATAASLASSGAVTGDLAANVTAIDVGLKAAIAGLQSVDPADAAKVVAYRAAVIAALHVYNSDAIAAGLPQIPNLPAV